MPFYERMRSMTMIQFLPVSEGNTIAIRVTGKLSHEDYQAFLPKLEEQINQLGKVSVLIELDNFKGWDLKAAKDDFEFVLKHTDNIERVAIVGDKTWEHWMVAMMKPFIPFAEVQYFNRENLQQAWDWLREPDRLRQSSEIILPYKNIVAAVDFSLASKHAARRAIELARLYKADLTLLHVAPEIIPYPTYFGDDFSGYVYDPELLMKQNEALLEQASQDLKEFIADLNTDLDIGAEVLSGDAERTILSFLEAGNADLVVFGGKKKKGFSKLLGSTPQYIQNHARCETLVVPLFDKTSFKQK